MFYFSILPDIKNKKTKSVIEIALHEISHFIFLEQLENLEINTKKEVIHYIKEALTTAILNQQKFRKFNIPKREGNPEIKYIQVEYKGTIYKLVNFVEEIIKEKGYHEGIKYIILLVNKASEKFFNKTSLWNKYGKNITEIHSIFKDYLKPVKINKG